MTLPMITPLDRLVGLRAPVVGIDLSTQRIAACVLGAAAASGAHPTVAWKTKTLPHAPHPAQRLVLIADTIVDFFESLEADHGLPARIGLEIPLAGRNTPLISLWAVGACYVGIGEAFGTRVHVTEWNPSSWKSRATGSGYRPGLPKDASKAKKRAAEKSRIGSWARDVMGYTGTMEDEQDATGVAVAEALMWMSR